jgi:hypothetical protein
MAKDMWDAVKHDATTKSSLHEVDILNQLQTIKCPSSADPKTHLAEVKAHFKKMTERREFLHVTKAPVTDSTYTTIIISSMPNTYSPTIQMVETTMKVIGKTPDPNDLIAAFIEEAEHRVIGEAQAKHAEAAMIASQSSKRYIKRAEKGSKKEKQIWCAKTAINPDIPKKTAITLEMAKKVKHQAIGN